MKSSEFINATSELLGSFGDITQKKDRPIQANRAILTPVQPELDDDTDPKTMVAPLQQKLELLKKAVDVNSYFDENNPGYDPGPGEGNKSKVDLDEIKRLAGVMHIAGDDDPFES